jgi:hypothetical protein
VFRIKPVLLFSKEILVQCYLNRVFHLQTSVEVIGLLILVFELTQNLKNLVGQKFNCFSFKKPILYTTIHNIANRTKTCLQLYLNYRLCSIRIMVNYI